MRFGSDKSGSVFRPAIVGGIAALVVAVAAFAQDPRPGLLPGALSSIKDPFERQTLEKALAGSFDEDVPARLCGVHRVPVANGTETLFVVVEMLNGRDYCNYVQIVRATPTPVVIQTLRPYGDTFEALVRDLDNDGDPELVVTTLLDDFGYACKVVVPVVYKCAMSGCSDQSGRYADFFFKLLENAVYSIAEKTSAGDFDITCDVIRRDKILRLLGRDKRAGLARAREWATSRDWQTRQKAAFVASDIDDPGAAELLDSLAVDKDEAVRQYARGRRYLRDRQRQDRSR